jgi:hypothetical protein
MKYLKRINELFDTEELRDQNEIPYLRGEISPKKLVSGENLIGKDDKLLVKLIESCPWIVELKYVRSGSILAIGFHETINHSPTDNVFYYLNIEIVEFTNKTYNINFNAKVMGNGREIYNESIRKGQLDINDVTTFLNKNCYPLVVDFNNYLSRMFSQQPVSYTNKRIRPFNIQHN